MEINLPGLKGSQSGWTSTSKEKRETIFAGYYRPCWRVVELVGWFCCVWGRGTCIFLWRFNWRIIQSTLCFGGQTWPGHYKKEKLQDKISHEHRYENPKRIQLFIKMIITMRSFFSRENTGWFKIRKSINIVHQINRIMEKNYMITSIDKEKASDKI